MRVNWQGKQKDVRAAYWSEVPVITIIESLKRQGLSVYYQIELMNMKY